MAEFHPRQSVYEILRCGGKELGREEEFFIGNSDLSASGRGGPNDGSAKHGGYQSGHDSVPDSHTHSPVSNSINSKQQIVLIVVIIILIMNGIASTS